MKFSIYTKNDNGTGMEYTTKEQFLHEVGLMVDDCIANGGTYFSINVDADESCFCTNDCNECPFGGDITDDCTDCAYANDYHFVNGECISRNI